MAKRKKKVVTVAAGVKGTIQSKYGKIIESGNVVLDRLNELSVLSVSPAIDLALGGGFREGQVIILGGDPKTGKTTTALYAAAKAQAAGKKVYYVNTEGRLTKHNFTGIKGLDIEAIEIIQSTDDKPMVSAETYLNVMEKLIKEEENLFFICDSTSNMVPQDELDGEIRTGVRNALPRLLSMFFKRTSGDVTRNKAMGVFILHNIANTGGSRFAPSKMQDCGNMIQFQAGTNMVITHRGKWEVPKESGNHVGQIANWKVMTSAAGGTPLTQFQSWIRYGVGIDEAQELGQIASEFALIQAKGAWYTFTSLIEDKDEPEIQKWLNANHPEAKTEEEVTKVFKFQGMEKVTTFLNEHEELKDYIYQQVREMFE